MTDGDDASAAEGRRSAISDELGVPEAPPDPEAAEHVLADDELQYPEFTFEEGSIGPDGGFELSRGLDREEMRAWLEGLSGGLASHDVAAAAPDARATFGVAPSGVRMAFEPGEDGVGEFEVAFRLKARMMQRQGSDEPKTGARGGRGFIPLAMLTGDRDPSAFRCYNWVENPTGDG